MRPFKKVTLETYHLIVAAVICIKLTWPKKELIKKIQ